MSKQIEDRVNILGVGISALNVSTAVASVEHFLESNRRGYICVTGMHGIMEAQKDPDFREVQNKSILTTPDGIPTVWLGHLDGFEEMKQVCGADFMRAVCDSGRRKGIRHFFYGGKPGVAERLRDVLVEAYPGLKVVGTYTPPFRPLNTQEEEYLKQQLIEADVDIFWCGISTPKQERFMAKYLDILPVKLMAGVGAAFDINAGFLKDSPAWAKKCGLQWAHRLYQEPRRLWRRYLLNIPNFVWLCMLQWSGVRSYELPERVSATLQMNGRTFSNETIESVQFLEQQADTVAS